MERQIFIQQCLDNPPSYHSEMLASESHETRDLPDPYFFILKNGKLCLPGGEIVDEYIETNTPLRKRELDAHKRIQSWVNENDSGIILWFSPLYKDEYPLSKIIIGGILDSNGHKILFNRSLKLNLTEIEMLSLAEGFGENFSDPEELRANPILVNEKDLLDFLEILSKSANETNLMEDGKDLKIKLETYASIAAIETSIAVSGRNEFDVSYHRLYLEAQEKNLIGPFQGSCGSSMNKDGAFNIYSKNSLSTNEVTFDCPKCHKPIPSGRGITVCPHCGARKEDYNSCV